VGFARRLNNDDFIELGQRLLRLDSDGLQSASAAVKSMSLSRIIRNERSKLPWVNKSLICAWRFNFEAGQIGALARDSCILPLFWFNGD